MYKCPNKTLTVCFIYHYWTEWAIYINKHDADADCEKNGSCQKKESSSDFWNKHHKNLLNQYKFLKHFLLTYIF